MKTIHKAVRPKIHYHNPTLCRAKFKDGIWGRVTAYENSRTTWDKVTCKNCLKLKK